MTVWLVVAVVGAGTIALKGVGPAVLGDRELPPLLASLVGVLAPTLLAALVVTQSVSAGDDGITVDARLVGVGAAAVAIALRAPLLVVVIVAAATTALIRAL